MQIAFDKIASSYDETFTNTKIGKKQRSIVWNFLERALPLDEKLDVLELNCGTGEDAIFLAKRGNNLTATDMSEEMLQITKEKVLRAGLENCINIKKLRVEEISKDTFNTKFDLIFSNFGGLNCVDENVLNKLSNEFKLLLKTNGRVILVLMPRLCLWESIYFLTKFKLNESKRRSRAGYTIANIGGSDVRTYYYSPSIIKNKFGNNFIVKKIIPIGFFIPPSYLDSYFKEKKKILNFLASLETNISSLSFLANAADHYLIDMELKD
jgi:ubiquinone/menaquinone biosynthesis C-methylase UbiE